MADPAIGPLGGRTLLRSGPLGTDLDEEEALKKKEDAKPQLPIFLVDEFERHLAQANLYSSQGKSVEASAELGKAHDWLKDVRDESLKKELRIRLDQARRLIRA